MKTMFAMRAALGGLLVAGLLAGCASGVKLDNQAPVESRSTTGAGADGAGGAAGGAAGAGAGQSSVTTVDLSRTAQDEVDALPRTVYFDFDSFVVKSEFRPVVEAHSRLLMANRAKQMIIEGHTDERGGREYNLALGQKRAEAVLRSLVLLGVNDGQLEAVSFGKERPKAQGSDEAAHAQNRRAELKDR
jgi:peptidoglycan-associated lipoprotein